MQQPVIYALLERGTVVNLIWLCAANAGEFSSAVATNGQAVRIGDLYENGAFLSAAQEQPDSL